jgi:hypothetical protein
VPGDVTAEVPSEAPAGAEGEPGPSTGKGAAKKIPTEIVSSNAYMLLYRHIGWQEPPPPASVVSRTWGIATGIRSSGKQPTYADRVDDWCGCLGTPLHRARASCSATHPGLVFLWHHHINADKTHGGVDNDWVIACLLLASH